jgi:hypothetical protein
MNVLELFSGTRSIAKAFEEKGHKVFSVEWDTKHLADLYKDIEFLQIDDIPFIPDIIWASPDCTTYSISAISHHRNIDRSGKSEYAIKCDRVNNHLWDLIDKYIQINPNLIYFVENPRGVYRKMNFVENRNRFTITYCQYGDKRMKPTDIFTNHTNPKFKPICKNGSPCHESAPRGSKTGTQGLDKVSRSKIPYELALHIVKISKEELK